LDYQTGITILILGIIFGAVLLYTTNKFIRRLVLWFRFKKARVGQDKAEKLLKKNGYSIVAKEYCSKIKVKVDDDLFETMIRADLIVEKDGFTYVAEVKTGQSATSLMDCGTRRQLLEYNFYLKPDGILLVDMDERKIHSIEFIGGNL